MLKEKYHYAVKRTLGALVLNCMRMWCTRFWLDCAVQCLARLAAIVNRSALGFVSESFFLLLLFLNSGAEEVCDCF